MAKYGLFVVQIGVAIGPYLKMVANLGRLDTTPEGIRLQIDKISPDDFDKCLWFLFAVEAFQLLDSDNLYKIEEALDRIIDYS